jgi:hypothetical protein
MKLSTLIGRVSCGLPTKCATRDICAMNFPDIEFKYDMKIKKKVALKWETQPDPTQACCSLHVKKTVSFHVNQMMAS